jgi:UDP-3-O-[3-hydroxymyristoyl] N-acetylglucosamine deacetylase/3-hydroxyacyl-[acyl-carrier-protein] dehydratase
LSGTGLHTGEKVNLTFNPAPENFGIKFQRVDLPDKPIIEADVDYVIDTTRGTTLGKNGTRVATVEHALAAIMGLQIDNLLIELDGPEVPILDGSSRFFVEALTRAGLENQTAERNYFEVPSNIYYTNPDLNVEMVAMPLDSYRLTVMIDYNSPVLGSQHASITHISEFRKEIATCRTYVFLHELEELYKNNLIKGGDVNNAIVVVDRDISEDEVDYLAKLFNKNKHDFQITRGGFLNNLDLRYHNEPARHKLLDLIGDLALVGVPLKAQIMAARPGHTSNVEFARRIKRAYREFGRKAKSPYYDPNKTPVMSTKQIDKILPHKYPFLLVDKIIELSSTHIIGVKNVTIDEPFFQGHFPGDPIMPGVLQIEAMAQVGGIYLLYDKPDPTNYSTIFLKIENARFKQKVLPGDTLVMRMDVTIPEKRGVLVMRGRAYVGNTLVTEAELMAQIIKNS